MSHHFFHLVSASFDSIKSGPIRLSGHREIEVDVNVARRSVACWQSLYGLTIAPVTLGVRSEELTVNVPWKLAGNAVMPVRRFNSATMKRS